MAMESVIFILWLRTMGWRSTIAALLLPFMMLSVVSSLYTSWLGGWGQKRAEVYPC